MEDEKLIKFGNQGISGISLTNQIIKPKISLSLSLDQIDGFNFKHANYAQYAWIIYIAYQARHGDLTAKYFLDCINLKILDLDGKQYWPMET